MDDFFLPTNGPNSLKSDSRLVSGGIVSLRNFWTVVVETIIRGINALSGRIKTLGSMFLFYVFESVLLCNNNSTTFQK